MGLSATAEGSRSHQSEHRHVRRRRSGPSSKSRGRASTGLTLWVVFCTLLAALLVYGWLDRNEKHWVPETGVGYWLGIAGGVIMLALLVYPLRKRFRSLRFLGPVPLWFRLHMAFGLLGPGLILLHCNFKSASLNASVALNAMLIVAGSGLIGRFLYGRVHSTLSGQRRAASTFFEMDDTSTGLHHRNQLFGLSESSLTMLETITKEALASPRGILGAIGHAWLVRWQTRQMARMVSREVRARALELSRGRAAGSRRQLRQHQRHFELDVASHLSSVRKAANLAIYERLFSLWHFLHLPLFLMLVIAVVVHIIAVHLY